MNQELVDGPEFLLAFDEWSVAALAVFQKLKDSQSLEDTWTFSISSLDDIPSDVLGGVLRDPQGAAAFALRRMQALQYLLAEPLSEFTVEHILELAAGLSRYLQLQLEGPASSSEELYTLYERTRRLLTLGVLSI